MSERHIVLHGHFYQPPREHPWLEEIETQDSAAPWHDWNERITAECYGPNSAARIVDAAGRVVDIIDNYAKISFNMGPTLLSWLERKAPRVYEQILAADVRSAAARGGHGNALAQAYGHAILPLASARDRRTQVRWGIADFRQRFGRDPRGMWLPECAVCPDTLACLVDEGMEFTILSQRQGRRHLRVAPERGDDDAGPGAGPAAEWIAGVDPRRPYRVELPGGRSITVFFFDAAVAGDVSFGGALADGDALARRLVAAFGHAEPRRPWLVNVATDGETFGHHRTFGDMALAAAIARLEGTPGVRLTNYGEYLAAHPPDHVAEPIYPSSWSCAHGVQRWQDDCGCTTGARPGWHQRWRAPLRAALDELAGRLDALYEQQAGALLVAPWRARDEYVELVLDRRPARLDAFLARHAVRPLAHGERVAALRLLELQRHALLMYTSCAWFFGEISGVETVQGLRYAVRAAQLAREQGSGDLLPALGAALARAPSNLAEHGDGGRVLAALARPKKGLVDLAGVVAQLALTALFEPLAPRGQLFCFHWDGLQTVRHTRGQATLAVGRVRLTSAITCEELDAAFVLVHFGEQDLRCTVVPVMDVAGFEDLGAQLAARFEHGSLGDVVRAVDRLGGCEYDLHDLFLDQRRRIMRVLVDAALARQAPQLAALFEENRSLLRFLVEADIPVPGPLRAAADHALSGRFVALVDEACTRGSTGEIAAELARVCAEAAALAATLDLDAARAVLGARIVAEARQLRAAPSAETAHTLDAYLTLAETIGLDVDRWEAQNLFWALWRDGGHDAGRLDEQLLLRVGERLGFAGPADGARRRYDSA